MKRIGIFGGTFNPIHYAHLRAAEEVLLYASLDEIMFIPNNIPPHRDMPKVSSLDRFNMVKMACKDNDCFTVNDIELKDTVFSYTADTVNELVKLYPDVSFSFIVGSDSLLKSVWKRMDEILANLEKFYIVYRPGFPKHTLVEKLQSAGLKHYNRFHWVKTEGLKVSSTAIRNMIKDGKSPRYLMPDNVLEYIKKNNLYK